MQVYRLNNSNIKSMQIYRPNNSNIRSMVYAQQPPYIQLTTNSVTTAHIKQHVILSRHQPKSIKYRHKIHRKGLLTSILTESFSLIHSFTSANVALILISPNLPLRLINWSGLAISFCKSAQQHLFNMWVEHSEVKYSHDRNYGTAQKLTHYLLVIHILG